MRAIILFGTFSLLLNAGTDSASAKLWTELKAKREKMAGIHQEFEVTRTSKSATHSQGSKSQIVLDMSKGVWREKFLSGSGNSVRIFDGTDSFRMEEGGDEYVRIKRRAKDPDPVPAPYIQDDVDWTKSREIDRRSCSLPGKDDQCVVLEVPLKPWSRSNSPSDVTRMNQGVVRVSIDLETGLVLGLRITAVIEARVPYQTDASYAVTRIGIAGAADASLFKLPPEAHEVKELSRWNAAKIKKQLGGKAAPELSVTDIAGKPVTLADFKGKTVLLDFWTTWCPPCRADAPALDKLYKKYSEHDLMIIGVSVSEDRKIVEKFLKEHPHSFPVVLSTENEMPQAYQIGTFPTYIVIERDGTVASAVEGDQGFGELRKLLKKAGLEVD
jgi:thiol-disulfide isomerase/thioredoxin